MENKEFTVDEVFAEINKLNSEEKVALSNNISLLNTRLLMNDLEQYKNTLKTIDNTMDSLTKTKSALKRLKRNMVNEKCLKLIEKAKAFIAPEDAFIMPDVRASEFARMVNVVAEVSRRSVAECSKAVYDILTHLSLLKNYLTSNEPSDESIIKDVSVLEQLDVDVVKTPFDLFAVLNNKKDLYDPLSLDAIARCLAGIYNAEFCKILIDKWLDVFNPISTQKVAESVYSLKETTEAMDRYFAGLKDKL